MKKNYIYLFFECLVFVILLLNLFVSKSINTIIIFLVLGMLGIFSIKFNKFKRVKIGKQKNYIIVTILMSLLFMTLYYYLGLQSSYEVNYSYISKGYISHITWVITLLIVIETEVIRYIHYSKKEEDSKYNISDILLFVIFVLLDVILSQKAYEFNGITQLYSLFSTVILGSIFKNILLNYISGKGAYLACFAYRLIVDLYIFVMPFIPKLNELVEAIIFIVFPYLLYNLMRDINYETSIKDVRDKKNIGNRLVTCVWTVLLVIFIVLISGLFKYTMIAIGSESMSGVIDKGDAIIYKKIDPKEYEIKKGDIVVFRHNDVTFVHRIDKIYDTDGVVLYRTKGDANDYVDTWTTYPEDIEGVVITTIKWIGIPSVFISELF